MLKVFKIIFLIAITTVLTGIFFNFEFLKTFFKLPWIRQESVLFTVCIFGLLVYFSLQLIDSKNMSYSLPLIIFIFMFIRGVLLIKKDYEEYLTIKSFKIKVQATMEMSNVLSDSDHRRIIFRNRLMKSTFGDIGGVILEGDSKEQTIMLKSYYVNITNFLSTDWKHIVTFFVPRIISPLHGIDDTDLSVFKNIKKIKFLVMGDYIPLLKNNGSVLIELSIYISGRKRLEEHFSSNLNKGSDRATFEIELKSSLEKMLLKGISSSDVDRKKKNVN